MELSKELEKYITSIRDSLKDKRPCNGLFSLIRNKSEIIREILKITEFLDDSYINISIGQRVWHIVNNVKNVIRCNCESPKKFYRFSDGYFNTCGEKKCKDSSKSLAFKETIEKKYNGTFLKKGSESRKKYENTMLEKYGTKDNLSGRFIEINRNIMIEKHGFAFPLQSKELLDKKNKTCLERHNTLDFFNCEKSNNTKIERFGYKNPMKNKNIRDLVLKNMIETKYNNLQEKLNIFNISLLKYNSNSSELKCNRCNTIFNNHPVTINAKLRANIDPCIKCNPLILTHSKAEKDLLKYIKSIYNDDIIENKKIFYEKNKSFEVDILLPKSKIAFEYNGLYWHSEIFKDPNYHIHKTEKLKELGIKLFHIWEDDWLFNNDLCKSIINNILGKNDRIYARKCEVKEISNYLYKNFCLDNHIQGYGLSSIRIGLFNKGELVSIMGFSKRRPILSGKNNNDYSYELVRLCSLKNTSIIGGASKMLKYFADNYIPKEIFSYCNISLSPFEKSNIYDKLGFIFDKKTTPGYYWVIDGKRHHRLNYTKYKLTKAGHDKKLTETEIMYDKGGYRIWDCGNYKYFKTYQ